MRVRTGGSRSPDRGPRAACRARDRAALPPAVRAARPAYLPSVRHRLRGGAVCRRRHRRRPRVRARDERPLRRPFLARARPARDARRLPRRRDPVGARAGRAPREQRRRRSGALPAAAVRELLRAALLEPAAVPRPRPAAARRLPRRRRAIGRGGRVSTTRGRRQEAPIRVTLGAASPVGRWREVATVTTRGRLGEAEARALRFDAWRCGGGLVPWSWPNRLREPAYRGSRLGRPDTR